MKERKGENRGWKGTLTTAAVVIGTGTLLFQGLTHAAAAMEFKKINQVPTYYVTNTGNALSETGRNLPEGYQKASYTVDSIDLEFYQKQTPTSIDITREEAAELGAQALWEIFGVDLEGQRVELGYGPPTDSLPRSYWYADVYVDGELKYYFDMDSVTGELFGIGRNRTLDENAGLGFDRELHKNPQKYEEMAKDLAEKYNVVNGAVQSVEYNSQGYSNNDPTITMHITGENGDLAMMTFSRYDQELLSIGYNASTKYALEFAEEQMRKLEDKVEELQKTVDPDAAPMLDPIELD
ncbi:hypothetical protein [Paenibacillus senegalensis]|uniref:hypothetical protein n=1 Tax=Paenibacillus senegalensis TaxID=1465766 RepID=UPI00028947F8|nr:hypothetical protein [Paenibacillus senegalensis]